MRTFFRLGALALYLSFALMAIAQQVETNVETVVPALVNFSGTLHDAEGKPRSGGVGITFALYKEAEGGAPLWLETQNVQLDATGSYSVMLGSTKSAGMPTDLFASGQARWLGIRVDGQDEQPRVLLLSVPYAMKAADAQTLGGLPASAFVQATSGGSKSSGGSSPQTTQSALSPATAKDVTTTGGTAQHIPLFTSATNIQSSIVSQVGTTAIDVNGKLGINTASPLESVDVTSGNAIVRGIGNFKAAGNTATLYIGDTNHPIEAAYSTGLSIGAFKSPKAIFIADFTGNVGIGTAKPTTGILNTVANTKSVIGLSTSGWNATTGSNASGTTAIQASGGNGDGIGNGATAAVFAGGAGGANPNGTGGGTGIMVSGGSGGSGYPCCGGDAIVANAGEPEGVGVVANGGDGERAFVGGFPGVLGTGGVGSGASDGPGLIGQGGSDTSGLNVGGDGIDAFPGTSGTFVGLAGSFSGDVDISGDLTVSGTKHFRIDHPNDPANRYLYHAAVESSEVLNLYTGNVVLDASGEAAVQVPDWFETLNRDFRYQLTAIGAAAPNLHIAQEIHDRSFRVAGGAPGMKVSWQVTGVRQDAWEKAHPMIVEVQKLPRERGYYINPELFGAPPEKSIEWARNPQLMKRLKSMQQKQAGQTHAMLTKPVK
jgi:trimeric autotransporter adhesin